MYGYGYGIPPMWRLGVGVDVNGDGISDYRVWICSRSSRIQQLTKEGFKAYPITMGMAQPSYGVDVNGNGITDFRVRPRSRSRC